MATPLEDLNRKIDVTVTRVGGENHITWDLPDGAPPGVQGVQVWRSNSPYALVRTLGNDTPGFAAARWIDQGPDAKATSRYLVTLFYGATVAQGFFAGGEAPSTTMYPGSAASTASAGGDDWPWWAVVLAVAAVLAIVVLGVLLVARRGRAGGPTAVATEGHEERSWEGAIGPGPALAPLPDPVPNVEIHPVRCPICESSFVASGGLPIRTTCPGCGRRGIVR